MSKWKFVLINDISGQQIDLSTEFIPEESEPDAEEGGLCDVWSSDAAHAEALEFLGFTLTVMKDRKCQSTSLS